MTTPPVTVSASEKNMPGKRTLTFTLKLEVEIDGWQFSEEDMLLYVAAHIQANIPCVLGDDGCVLVNSTEIFSQSEGAMKL